MDGGDLIQGVVPERIRDLKCLECHTIEMGLYMYSTCRNFEELKQFNKYMEMARQHNPDTHENLPKKYSHVGNGRHNGLWAGTLTKASTWTETEDDMVAAMEKIFSQQTCPVENYAWYVEYTDAGLPHIHFIYRTMSGGRIHAKVFKRYWKQWDEKRRLGKGHQGGYHKEVDSEVAYKEYIEKDSGRSGSNWPQNKISGMNTENGSNEDLPL